VAEPSAKQFRSRQGKTERDLSRRSLFRRAASSGKSHQGCLIVIKLDVNFPYVHDLAELLTLVEKAGQAVPERIKRAEKLSRFAVFTRYPGIGPAIKEPEYKEAVEVAMAVVKWAENIVLPKRRK
jgi:HEPN domain-containing protein